MPLRFDAAMKVIAEKRPAAFLQLAGLPMGEVEVIKSNASVVSAAADTVTRVRSPGYEFLMHVEFECDYVPNEGSKVLRYNSIVDYGQTMDVRGVVVLLRRKADGPNMTGIVERFREDGTRYLYFEYTVIRVWELSAAWLLKGDIGALALAPISNVTKDELPGIIRKMEERVRAEASHEDSDFDVREMWAAAYVLLGLRYSNEFADQLMKGVTAMKESTTYMGILNEGQVQEARKTLLRQGIKRCGPPSPATIAAIESMTSLERLEQLADRLFEVENWSDLGF